MDKALALCKLERKYNIEVLGEGRVVFGEDVALVRDLDDGELLRIRINRGEDLRLMIERVFGNR